MSGNASFCGKDILLECGKEIRHRQKEHIRFKCWKKSTQNYTSKLVNKCMWDSWSTICKKSIINMELDS
jgi:hypothetical protein